jgi:hypothetical protein
MLAMYRVDIVSEKLPLTLKHWQKMGINGTSLMLG